MPSYILHHKGAYQIFSTIVDAPLHPRALTRDEVVRMYPADIEARLERAHATGCSAMNPAMTLRECIEGNRAGEDESEVPYEEFVETWLTLPAKRKVVGDE